MCLEKYNTFKLKIVSPIIENNKQNSKVDLDVQKLSDSRGRLGPPEGMLLTGGSGLARVRGHVKSPI